MQANAICADFFELHSLFKEYTTLSAGSLKIIEERQTETVEILRGWMEDDREETA